MNYEELLQEAYEKVSQIKPCERFSVPKVMGHIEGNKTIISNFQQISICIRRDAEHLAKFLGKELASSVVMNNGRLILSRKITLDDINKKIEKYVRLFIICPNCSKPDTEIIEHEGKNFIKCMACGKQIEIHKI